MRCASHTHGTNIKTKINNLGIIRDSNCNSNLIKIIELLEKIDS